MFMRHPNARIFDVEIKDHALNGSRRNGLIV